MIDKFVLKKLREVGKVSEYLDNVLCKTQVEE